MASRDDRQTFDGYQEINSSWNPCACCTTAATYGADGRLALLYREETNNDRDMFLVLADQRGAKPWHGRTASLVQSTVRAPERREWR